MRRPVPPPGGVAVDGHRVREAVRELLAWIDDGTRTLELRERSAVATDVLELVRADGTRFRTEIGNMLGPVGGGLLEVVDWSCAVTSVPYDAASISTLLHTPSRVLHVELNGIPAGTDTLRLDDFYWSSDGGLSATGSPALGDSLYVGTGLGFTLAAADTITVWYER